jgi:site-specific DNA-methyltransferase (cytosine-N4-specific)
VAFALQADGWYLRSDIIWHKPNPMPESVTDRPTKAHEYLFLLAKQERYFYDAEAIREQSETISQNVSIEEYKTRKRTFHDHSSDFAKGMMQGKTNGFVPMNNPAGRNKRSVWTIATQPYAEAHFATFPEDLVKPCILAGSRPGDAVLDPFAGSGTVGKVALELGRKAVLIELNPDYIELAKARTFVTPGMF